MAYDDVHGNLSKFTETVGADHEAFVTEFGYDEENRPTSLNYGSHGQTTLTYDKLGRVRQSSVKAGNGVTNTTTYAFELGGHGENSTTGLIAINDLVALGALRELNRLNLRVPEDVALIGCDNQFFTHYLNPR